jgi:hypothetical protein
MAATGVVAAVSCCQSETNTCMEKSETPEAKPRDLSKIKFVD